MQKKGRKKTSKAGTRAPKAAAKAAARAAKDNVRTATALAGIERVLSGVEHIGIAVRDSDQAARLMCAILGAKVIESIVSHERGLKLTFLDLGETKVELLEPLTGEGTVAKFLETEGEGFHHIAFRVSDIKSALTFLRQAGVKLVEPAPQKGAHGNLMAFIHPSSACGILVELCERK